MWLFAFFPGTDVDGVGCIWARGLEADNWFVGGHPMGSGYPWNAGVVAAAWINNDRQVSWAVSWVVVLSPLTEGSSGGPITMFRIVYRPRAPPSPSRFPFL